MNIPSKTKRKQAKLSLSGDPNSVKRWKKSTENDKLKQPNTEDLRTRETASEGKMIRNLKSTGDSGIFSLNRASGGLFRRVDEPKRTLEIHIENFKSGPELPQNYFQVTWERLRKAVVAVFHRKKLEYTYEELYRDVENLCCNGKSAELLKNLEEEMKSQMLGIRSSLWEQATKANHPSVASGSENALARHESRGHMRAYLEALNRAWSDYCEHLKTVRNVFTYLNQTYAVTDRVTRTGSRTDTIWDMGLGQMRETLLEEHTRRTLVALATAGVLEEIRRDRCGEATEVSLLGNLIRMYLHLNLEDEFFKPFFAATQRFYEEECLERLTVGSVSEYLDYIEFRRDNETRRCQQYLNGIDQSELLRVVNKVLIEAHAVWIVDNGLHKLLSARMKGHLRKMYVLLDMVESLAYMKKRFSEYIYVTAVEFVKIKDKHADMVKNLLGLKSEMDFILGKCFSSNPDFKDSIRDSFEQAVNSLPNKPAELVAKYVDQLMKDKGKHAAEGDLEAVLGSVMALFRFIQGKDVFEAFYKNYLANRLLNGRSASYDSEKLMLRKLKEECGSAFTKKLEGMFKDIEISHDLMRSFREKNSEEIKKSGIDLNVSVLTISYWPTYVPMQVKLPQEMKDFQALFSSFYLSKHGGRKLYFQHSHGFCTVKAHFKKGDKELVLSIPQYVVLKAVVENEGEGKGVGLSTIRTYTNLEAVDLKRTLQSLACYKKIRLLIKSSRGTEIAPDDLFRINWDFSHQLVRIKVISIQVKETEKDVEDTYDRVAHDRQYEVDACVVRLMKNLKAANHHQLISEIYKQMRFQITTDDLKKRIESLIERSYLERDEKDPSLYKYLA